MRLSSLVRHNLFPSGLDTPVDRDEYSREEFHPLPLLPTSIAKPSLKIMELRKDVGSGPTYRRYYFQDSILFVHLIGCTEDLCQVKDSSHLPRALKHRR